VSDDTSHASTILREFGIVKLEDSKEHCRQQAYPEIGDFFATKKKYDPVGLFSNKFYEKYER